MKATVAQATRDRVAAWMNLQQANRVIQGILEERLGSETNLSWAEFEVLWRLQIAAEHPLRMNQIATQLIGSPSGTTRIADRLERDGLIARETPKDNRRVVEVKLTPRGRTVLNRADRVFREVLEETFASHLSEAEVLSLRHIMRKLLERNGAWAEARCEPPPPH
jgi:DNA-binding MarR family transcriptional regulator